MMPRNTVLTLAITPYMYVLLSLCNGTPAGQRQVSSYDQKWPSLARDGDPGTCSLTGHHTQPWWQYSYSSTQNVTSVHIKGTAGTLPNPALRLRIRVGMGNDAEDNELATPPHDICAEWVGPIVSFDRSFPCQSPKMGDTITVQSINALGGQLRVCEVELNA